MGEVIVIEGEPNTDHPVLCWACNSPQELYWVECGPAADAPRDSIVMCGVCIRDSQES